MTRSVAIITGASRGIGAAITRKLAQDGFAVAINCASNLAEAQALADELQQAGTPALAIQADVADAAQVRQMFDRVEAELGPVQVLVNNSYLGLIRQAQRGFEMDYCVQLAFENQNVTDPELQGYGVDHVQVILGLGCKAIRVTDPAKLQDALREAQVLARKHRVPVVVEVILERVTNIAMGTEIDNIVEFEEIDCRHPEGVKGLAEAGLLE